MPDRLLIANWKLNKTVTEARAFFAALKACNVLPKPGVEVALAPPLTALFALTHEGATDLVSLCAQAAGPEQHGAFTGDNSPRLLADAGARYALVGHSEARARLGEQAPRIAATVAACWQGDVAPVLCVGEPAAERERGGTRAHLAQQIESALGPNAAALGPLVVAYEPVWAIGAGKPAGLDLVAEAIGLVRELTAACCGQAQLAQTRFLYGGGVQLADVQRLMATGGLDGLLVGKASLDAQAVRDMVEAMGAPA